MNSLYFFRNIYENFRLRRKYIIVAMQRLHICGEDSVFQKLHLHVAKTFFLILSQYEMLCVALGRLLLTYRNMLHLHLMLPSTLNHFALYLVWSDLVIPSSFLRLVSGTPHHVDTPFLLLIKHRKTHHYMRGATSP